MFLGKTVVRRQHTGVSPKRPSVDEQVSVLLDRVRAVWGTVHSQWNRDRTVLSARARDDNLLFVVIRAPILKSKGIQTRTV